MKKPLKSKSAVMLCFALGAACCMAGEGFTPLGSRSRKENKDGDILAKYDRDAKKGYTPGIELEVRGEGTNVSKVAVTNCLEFVDAKLDKSSNRLAVVFFNGIVLMYQHYSFTNATWRLVQNVPLVFDTVAFATAGNRLELQDFNTVRASFIRGGESFSINRPRGVERAGDRVFLFAISESGAVTINGKERKSLQWHPTDESDDDKK